MDWIRNSNTDMWDNLEETEGLVFRDDGVDEASRATKYNRLVKKTNRSINRTRKSIRKTGKRVRKTQKAFAKAHPRMVQGAKVGVAAKVVGTAGGVGYMAGKKKGQGMVPMPVLGRKRESISSAFRVAVDREIEERSIRRQVRKLAKAASKKGGKKAELAVYGATAAATLGGAALTAKHITIPAYKKYRKKGDSRTAAFVKAGKARPTVD